MKPLNRSTLFKIVHPNWSASEMVLQFGTGNFLRAFADRMIEELNEKTGFNGSVVMVKTTPSRSETFQYLKEQEGLFHLLTRGIEKGRVVHQNKIVTCVKRLIHPWQEFDHYLKLAESETLKFVISNTTEAGITFDEKDVLSDRPANSFPGKLTQLLYRRFQHFGGDLTKGWLFLPCELIEKNGLQLEECILRYARHWQLGKKFEKWVHQANTFCNTLVDQIVSGFPQEKAAAIQGELGFEDRLMMVAEPYHLWAIEAPVAVKETLPFDKTGLNVRFTNDLTPFRKLKIRILNGAHTAMMPVGLLAGLTTVRETVEHPETGAFVRRLIFEEILPTLDFPERELEKYTEQVLDRFRNPYLQHRLLDISLHSISKFHIRLLPSLLEYVRRRNALPEHLVSALGALIIFYKSEKNRSREEPRHASFFKKIWSEFEGNAKASELVEKVLKYNAGWGTELSGIPGLAERLTEHLEKFSGVRTLK